MGGRHCWVGVGGRRPSRIWDSPSSFFYSSNLKSSEGAPGQLQMPRLSHHITSTPKSPQPPSAGGEVLQSGSAEGVAGLAAD